MKISLQNCYIFLKNIDNQDDQKKTTAIKVVPSIYSLVMKEIPNATRITNTEENRFFKKTLNAKIPVNNTDVNATITIFDVKDATYVNVTVDSNEICSGINCLEKIHLAFSSFASSDDYIMVISYDAISEYYCNKIFPKLNRLERDFRRLLLNTYTINFGRNYFDDIDVENISLVDINEEKLQVVKKMTETVKQSLGQEMVLRAIAETEGVEISDEKFQKKASEYAAQMGSTDVDAFISQYGKSTIMASILQDEAVEILEKNAVVKNADGTPAETTAETETETASK